jgi:tRNA uridine 5-carboxymethylaminomethyl modification enzyme
LRRPEVDWSVMLEHEPRLHEIEASAAQQVVYDIKYAGYVDRQQGEIERHKRLAGKSIPLQFDYDAIKPLRTEAKQKLSKIRPLTLDQAQRISGITPARINVIHDDHEWADIEDDETDS